MSWNVAGLKGIEEEGWKFIKKYDVVCLQETWMEAEKEEKIKARQKGYEVEVREAKKGGSRGRLKEEW